jgi:hypothetical protein
VVFDMSPKMGTFFLVCCVNRFNLTRWATTQKEIDLFQRTVCRLIALEGLGSSYIDRHHDLPRLEDIFTNSANTLRSLVFVIIRSSNTIHQIGSSMIEML